MEFSGSRAKDSERTVHALIGLIYEAAMNPALWEEFLKAFSEAVGSTGSAVFSQDHNAGDRQLTVAHRYDPDYLRRYVEPFTGVNVRLQRLSLQTKSAENRGGQGACSESALLRTECYNDSLEPQDPFFGLRGTILRNGFVTANITAMRLRGAAPFGEQETALLGLLMPHLQRALKLHWRMANLDAERSAWAEVFDKLAAGIVLARANGQVVSMNRAARQIIDRQDGLSIGPSGLSAAKSSETTKLHLLIGDAAMVVSQSTVDVPRSTMMISRPSDRRSLFLSVVPLSTEYVHTGLLAAGGFPSAIIIISDPDAGLTPIPSDLQRSFALTPAEARFASVLVSGRSVAEAAKELQITMHTARTHLKRVLSKTRTRRQGELIRLILSTCAHLRFPAHK